jgi:hypothetical protein
MPPLSQRTDQTCFHPTAAHVLAEISDAVAAWPCNVNLPFCNFPCSMPSPVAQPGALMLGCLGQRRDASVFIAHRRPAGQKVSADA